MLIAILAIVFLLVLLFVPIYFFWIREKANNPDQEDPGQNSFE